MLVLDHWDQAQENHEICVDVDMLAELHDFVRSERSDSAGLGLILVTRFPTTEALTSHTRWLPNTGPVRYSQEMDQQIESIGSFPHLGCEATGAWLTELGCPRELHDLVHSVCGGRIGLLEAASSAVKTADSEEGLIAALQDKLQSMLEKSLLPSISAKFTGHGTDPWELVVRQIDRGADPLTGFGLPTAEDSRLPAALLAFRRPRPVLLVDVPHVHAALMVAGVRTE